MIIDNLLSYLVKKFELINVDLSFIMFKVIRRVEINGLENVIKEFN